MVRATYRRHFRHAAEKTNLVTHRSHTGDGNAPIRCKMNLGVPGRVAPHHDPHAADSRFPRVAP